MNKNILFIIDMQNDFTTKEGSLYVNGSENDVNNLCEFIKKNRNAIETIITSQDRHYQYNICHPKFWVDENGEHPLPFTEISSADIAKDKFRPYDESILTYIMNYFNKLSNLNKKHTIWPYHCICGLCNMETKGCKLNSDLLQSIQRWEGQRYGNIWYRLYKGENPYTEQYSVFTPFYEAKCENYEVDTNVIIFKDFLKQIDVDDRIFIAGEAQTHCVKETLKDMMHYFPDYMSRVVILTDCMSPIGTDFEINTDEVYKKAVEKGAILATSKDYKF